MDISNSEFIQSLIVAIGGFSGASTLAVVGIIVQLLIKFFKTPIALFASKYKLVIVSGLSVVGAVIGLSMQGVDLLSAIMSGGTLAAIQVFVHQIYKQFIEKRG